MSGHAVCCFEMPRRCWNGNLKNYNISTVYSRHSIDNFWREGGKDKFSERISYASNNYVYTCIIFDFRLQNIYKCWLQIWRKNRQVKSWSTCFEELQGVHWILYFFSKDFRIFRTLVSLGVSECTHTRQVEHQRCSRTGRVQNILRKNTIFNEHLVL